MKHVYMLFKHAGADARLLVKAGDAEVLLNAFCNQLRAVVALTRADGGTTYVDVTTLAAVTISDQPDSDVSVNL